MDYKEKVIAILNSQELSKEQKEKLENIFPELKEKESEDEKIRKELCKAIWTYIPYEEAQEYITWLEKQGEKKPTENAKTLNADNVIEWLNENVADFWANPCNPNRVINQFKKDFEL